MAMLVSKNLTVAQESYLHWGSIWWILIQESNAQPTELASTDIYQLLFVRRPLDFLGYLKVSILQAHARLTQ